VTFPLKFEWKRHGPLEREGPAGLERAGWRCWGQRGPAAAPSQLGLNGFLS